jgi:hypothetical protein
VDHADIVVLQQTLALQVVVKYFARLIDQVSDLQITVVCCYQQLHCARDHLEVYHSYFIVFACLYLIHALLLNSCHTVLVMVVLR